MLTVSGAAIEKEVQLTPALAVVCVMFSWLAVVRSNDEMLPNCTTSPVGRANAGGVTSCNAAMAAMPRKACRTAWTDGRRRGAATVNSEDCAVRSVDRVML